MNLIEKVLLRLTNAISKRKNAVFTCEVIQQKKFLASLPEPKTDIERSYYQYLCQMFLDGRAVAFVYNLGALFVIPFLLVIYLLSPCPKSESRRKMAALFLNDGKPENILPNELRHFFEDVVIVSKYGTLLLRGDANYILHILKKYPFSYLFLLKCIIKIARYRYLMEVYQPHAFIVCNEYSFTSSLLTDYCNRHGVKHINVMHGEKLFFIRDSFFHYDVCYVWDEYYAELFKRLRAADGQFVVAVPDSLKFQKSKKYEKVFDYTYYLMAEDRDRLKLIAELLKELRNVGKEVSVRPHPRYSDIKEIKELLGENHIEDTHSLTIEQSLLETRNAISLYSTVLLQAHYNNINVIIDDVSSPDMFKKLTDTEYFLTSRRSVSKLSSLVKWKK